MDASFGHLEANSVSAKPVEQRNRSGHLQPLVLPSTLEVVGRVPAGDTKVTGISRSERRCSFPALGINLGPSGPSYGRTLKRTSVTVHSSVNRAFEQHDKPQQTDRLITESPGVHALKHTIVSELSKKRPPSSITRSVEDGSKGKVAPRNAMSNFGYHSKIEGASQLSSSLDLRQASPTSARIQPCSIPPGTSLRSLDVKRLQLKNDSRARNLAVLTNISEASGAQRIRIGHTLSLPHFQESSKDGRPKHQKACPRTQPLHAKWNMNPKHEENWELREFRLLKKRQIFRELVETERRYLDSLKVIQTHYLEPITISLNTRDECNRPILPKKTTANIFSNFTAIFGLSQHFLSALEHLAEQVELFTEREPNTSFPCENEQDSIHQLRSQLASPNDSSKEIMLGGTLLDFLPFFKLYTTFTCNFSVSQAALHLHSASHGPSPAFAKLLSDCRSRGVGGGLGLSHMLLGIIQRVPRYEMMIKDLVKFSSPEGDSDYVNLLSAKTMVSYVARRLEMGLQEQEETKVVLMIQRSMECLTFPLVVPSRKLIKIGRLKKSNRKGFLQDRVFFLFNDCLIYAGILKNVSTENVDQWIRFLASKIVPFSGAERSTDHMQLNPLNLLSNPGYGEECSAWFIFCRKMELSDITTVGTASAPGPQSINVNGFQIISSAKSFVVCADDAIQTRDWINSLREAKDDLLDRRRTLFVDQQDSKLHSRKNNLRFFRPRNSSSPSDRGVSWLSLTSSDDNQSNSARFDSSELILKSPSQSTGNPPAMDTLRPSQSLSHQTPPRETSEDLSDSITLSAILTPISSILNWKSFIRRGLSNLSNVGLNDRFFEPFDHGEQAVSPSNGGLAEEDRDLNRIYRDSGVHTFQSTGVSGISPMFVAENYCSPVWVPDSSAKWCMASCSSRFGLLTRRHHCRLCGGVFCAACSSRTFVIDSEEGQKPARACESCFKSVFLASSHSPNSCRTSTFPSNHPSPLARPQDDLALTATIKRTRSHHQQHGHRQSLPVNMGSAHFRHTLVESSKEDSRTSMASRTSLGEESSAVAAECCHSSALIDIIAEDEEVLVNLNEFATNSLSNTHDKLMSLLHPGRAFHET